MDSGCTSKLVLVDKEIFGKFQEICHTLSERGLWDLSVKTERLVKSLMDKVIRERHDWDINDYAL